jgi:hypothetical protein
LKKFQDPRLHQDIEEHGAAYMEFDGGLTYYYERGSGAHCEAANETRLCGTLGSARFGFCSWDAPEIEVFDVGKDGSERKETVPVDMTGHRDDDQEWMTHFLDCLLNGAAPLMTVDLAAKHLDILFRILDAPPAR